MSIMRVPDDIRRSHLEPVDEIGKRVAAELDRVGAEARIAVLPEGPMTIPYLEHLEPA